uniref:Uncharacterized protein n=1 Tax=Aegilops tauschii subsp. strangulata TaxID=200361 RepID=A0A453NZE6_AEGTS
PRFAAVVSWTPASENRDQSSILTRVGTDQLCLVTEMLLASMFWALSHFSTPCL